MKKLIISLILLVPVLTGCANVETLVTINDDKSASVATSLTYQGDLSDKSDVNALMISENYNKFLDSDYRVEDAYSAKLSTITATKSVENLRKTDLDLSSLGFKSNLPSKKFIEVKKNFLVSSYNIDCVYDLGEQAKNIQKYSIDSNVTGASVQGFAPEYYQKYGDIDELEPSKTKDEEFASNLDEDTKQLVNDAIADNNTDKANTDNAEFTSSFSIQVPSFASYNNADSVSGNVYTWNLQENEPTEIKLQYVQYSGFAIGFIILLGILLLVVLARKILNHDSQKRIDNVDNIV